MASGEQPASKKQKINASAECSITGVKLSSENLIQVGSEKFWAVVCSYANTQKF